MRSRGIATEYIVIADADQNISGDRRADSDVAI